MNNTFIERLNVSLGFNRMKALEAGKIGDLLVSNNGTVIVCDEGTWSFLGTPEKIEVELSTCSGDYTPCKRIKELKPGDKITLNEAIYFNQCFKVYGGYCVYKVINYQVMLFKKNKWVDSDIDLIDMAYTELIVAETPKLSFLYLPNGTQFRASYKGQLRECVMAFGTIITEAGRYNPSNDWIITEIKNENGGWESADRD